MGRCYLHLRWYFSVYFPTMFHLWPVYVLCIVFICFLYVPSMTCLCPVRVMAMFRPWRDPLLSEEAVQLKSLLSHGIVIQMSRGGGGAKPYHYQHKPCFLPSSPSIWKKNRGIYLFYSNQACAIVHYTWFVLMLYSIVFSSFYTMLKSCVQKLSFSDHIFQNHKACLKIPCVVGISCGICETPSPICHSRVH